MHYYLQIVLYEILKNKLFVNVFIHHSDLYVPRLYDANKSYRYLNILYFLQINICSK